MSDRTTRVTPVAAIRERQQALESRPKRCSISQSVGDAFGVSPGEQIRIEAGGRAAAYTVADVHQAGHELHMAAAGRRRLGVSVGTPVALCNEVPAPNASLETAWRDGEFVELLWRTEPLVGGATTEVPSLGILAPHGGAIEPGTDRVAGRLYKTLNRARVPMAVWVGAGFGPAARRWHIPAETLAPRSFPRLAALADCTLEYVISLHSSDTERVLLAGGLGRQLRPVIAAQFREHLPEGCDTVPEPTVTTPQQSLLVDRLADETGSGLKIELPRTAPCSYQTAVVRALASALQSEIDVPLAPEFE